MSYADRIRERREAERAQQRAEERREQQRQEILERRREEERELERDEQRRVETKQAERELAADEERQSSRSAAYRALLRSRKREERRAAVHRSAARQAMQLQRREEQASSERSEAIESRMRAESRETDRALERAAEQIAERLLAARENRRIQEQEANRDRQRREERAQQVAAQQAAAQQADSERGREQETSEQNDTRERAREARRSREREEERRNERRSARAGAQRQERIGEARQSRESPRPSTRSRISEGRFSGQLPWLSIRGRSIASESGIAVSIRAVRFNGLLDADFNANGLFERAAAMGATAVCTALALNGILYGAHGLDPDDYLDALDATISSASSAGLYTILTLGSASADLIPDERFALQANALWDQDVSAAWGLLARRYWDEPALLFLPLPPFANALGRELLPGHPITLESWRYWQLSMLGEIRRARPRGIVIASACTSSLSGTSLRYMDDTEPVNTCPAVAINPEAWLANRDGYRSFVQSKPLLAFVYPENETGSALENWYRGLLSSGLHLVVNNLDQLEGSRDVSQAVLGNRERPMASAFARIPAPPNDADWNDWQQAFRSPVPRLSR